MSALPDKATPCVGCGTPLTRCVACAVKAVAADVAKDYGPMMGQMILAKLQTYLAKLAEKDAGK